MSKKPLELGSNQLLIQDKIYPQCKGRNGYFNAVAATFHQIPGAGNDAANPGYAMLDIEGSRSILGADSPISIRLSPRDMKNLALFILEKMGEEETKELWRQKAS